MGLNKIIVGGIALVGIAAIACLPNSMESTSNPLDAIYRTAVNQSPGYLSQREKELFDFINSERAKAGIDPLIFDPALNMIAEIRASEIVTNFSHENDVFGAKNYAIAVCLSLLGRTEYNAAENLARNNYPLYERSTVAIRDLMKSPEHRENILNPNYVYLGVGELAVLDPDGIISYFAMIFSD